MNHDLQSLSGTTLQLWAISVVMAVHNGCRFLPAQIASLLQDLQPQDEVIIVDDASTDGSYEWLQSLGDPRIQLHRNVTNQGVRCSFERGLKLSTNELVFLCDQDDEWLAGKRSAFVESVARDPAVTVVISDAQIVDGDSRIFADSFMLTRGGFRGGFWANFYRNRYLGCAMAIRRRVLYAALPIPTCVPMHDMWLGLLGCLMGRVVYLQQPWLRYRRHGGNFSPSSRQPLPRVLLWRMNLLRALTMRLAALAIRRVRALTMVPASAGQPRR